MITNTQFLFPLLRTFKIYWISKWHHFQGKGPRIRMLSKILGPLQGQGERFTFRGVKEGYAYHGMLFWNVVPTYVICQVFVVDNVWYSRYFSSVAQFDRSPYAIWKDHAEVLVGTGALVISRKYRFWRMIHIHRPPRSAFKRYSKISWRAAWVGVPSYAKHHWWPSPYGISRGRWIVCAMERW